MGPAWERLRQQPLSATPDRSFTSTDPDKITATNAYEVNIYDQRPDPTYGTGAIVNVAKVSPMPKAGGPWNAYEITARGAEDGQSAAGPFASSSAMAPTMRQAGPSSGARCRSSLCSAGAAQDLVWTDLSAL